MPTSKFPTRLKWAIALAPLSVPLFLALFIAGNSTLRFDDIIIFVFGAPCSYLSLFLFGWPAALLLQRYEKLNRLNLTLAGAVVGVFAWFAILILFQILLGSSQIELGFLFDGGVILGGAFFGSLVAGCVALIAGKEALAHINNAS